MDYKLNLNVSLAGLSWPLYDVLQCSFYIRLKLYFGLYHGPMLLWASTRIDLTGTNIVGLGSHTLVSSPRDSI
jgi:hypothetical protein